MLDIFRDAHECLVVNGGTIYIHLAFQPPRATDTTGEDIEEVFRRFTGSISLRGVTLRQALPPASVDAVHRRWSPLPTKGHIVYMRGLLYLAAERVPVGARILLPLSERGDGTVTGLIGITVCDWLRPTEVNCPPGVDVHYIPVADLDTVASPGAAIGP